MLTELILTRMGIDYLQVILNGAAVRVFSLTHHGYTHPTVLAMLAVMNVTRNARPSVITTLRVAHLIALGFLVDRHDRRGTWVVQQ